MTAFTKDCHGVQLDLGGIIPPMVTAFDPETEEIDTRLIEREVDALIGAGVPAICVGGSTGEGQGLSVAELRLLNSTVVNKAAGRVKIIAGIISDTTHEAVEKSQAVADTGVDALQLTPPHYLWKPNTAGLVRHFDRIGKATQLPILIYNVVPWADIDVGAMDAIIDGAEWVLGVKQSGGNMHHIADMMMVVHEKVPVTTGIDDLIFPALTLGVDGAITCLTAVLPEMCVQLYERVRAADYATARDIHSRLLPIWRSIEGPGMPANAKFALKLMGRDNGVARMPIQVPDTAKKASISTALKAAGLI